MGPLFLFFSSLFSPVFCLFSCFFIFLFSHFLFISSFFDFLMFFHFLFSFFQQKKFLLFFFLGFLSNIFCFLALVSEFNCFLRSRCSMEMWCPDDIGRDSWDWVGPPAWGRACFNSPEWGGGSSPVKTEPPQIVLLLLLLSLLLFLKRLKRGKCPCQQSPVLTGMWSPRWRRTLRHRGLQKLALNSGTTRRSAKNASKPIQPPYDCKWK